MDPVAQVAASGGLSLPAAVGALHGTKGTVRYQGTCEITRGQSTMARLALRMGSFPAAGTSVPITLTTCTDVTGTSWHRDFGGHVTRSQIWASADNSQVIERFGPIQLHMRLRLREGQLHYDLSRMQVLGLPVPRALTPRSKTWEYQTPAGDFGFDVSATLPLIGLLIRYRGQLRPA